MKLEEAYKIVEEETGLYNKNKEKICVYGSEGHYPHLHYYFKNVEGCVRLDIPRYFCHEKYHEGLDNSKRKMMIEWLEKNWSRCVFEWNKNSKQEKILIKEMPNYELLPKLQPNGKLAKEDRK